MLFSSTLELAAAIRARQLSSTEALAAQLSQIDRHNGGINAVVALDVEGARHRAREADDALARGELWGPLHGVPFTLKDTHGTAGLVTTVGSPSLAKHVPQEDSPVVHRLKQAGAVLMGKTNVAEMLGDFQCANPLFGRTSNPWNLARTSGGSSGGAAAALAAGMTPFEIGTDLSASIRLPSSYCGVYGLKPTEHRVSLEGVVPNPQGLPRSVRIMSSVGPMARTVDDLALVLSVIAGPDGRDTDVPPVPLPALDTLPALEPAKLRIAYATSFGSLPVAAEIRGAVEELAATLAGAGAIVEAALPQGLDVDNQLSSAGALIGMVVGAFLPSSDAPPPSFEQYIEALAQRDRAIIAWEQFFERWDVLLCPASMVTAFEHCKPGTPLRVDGSAANYYAVSGHGALFNHTGHPAVALPYRLDRDGLPLGVQLVGKRWDDMRLLAMARAVARLTGGFQRPPGY